MQDNNEIYQFMKANNLTDKDEKTFLNEYSSPQKAKDLYSFFQANKLTDKDETSFYDTYLKKKEPSVSSVTKLPSPNQQVSSANQIGNVLSGGVFQEFDETKVPKKENEYFKKVAVGIRPSAQGDIVERIYENPMGVDVLQIAPPKREQKPKEVTAQAETKDKSLRGVKPIPAAKYEYEDVGQGDFLNTVSALDRGFYKNLVGNPVKGLGTLLEQGTAKITGGSGKAFISDALISFGDYFNNAIDELAPQDENFKNSLLDQFGQAFGQVASLITTGGVGALGKTAAASTALKSAVPKAASVSSAAKTLGSQLLSPTSVSAGLSMGQSEFDRAKQAGATDEQAFEVFYKNAAVGSILEKIPVMQFLKRFNQATKGGVANYIKTKGVAGITGGLEEMTTEMLQQLYANKTARDVYNLNESIFNGLAESGGVGFGVGFLLNAMGAKAKILRKQGKVADATILELQIDDFKEKAKTQEPATKQAAPSAISDVDLQEQVEVLPTRERFVQEGDKFYEVVADGRQMTKTEITEDDYNQGKLLEETQKVKAKEEVIVEEKVKPIVNTESLESGGLKYYISDENGNQVGVAEVSTVDDKIIIDNVFVDEKNKRKGFATSIIDKIIEDFRGRKYEYVDQDNNEFSIPYKIETGTIVSEEGEALSKSVKKKIEDFNKQQELAQPEISQPEISQPIELSTDITEDIIPAEKKKLITVQTPQEVKKQQEKKVATIGAKEYTPEPQKRGVSVILPTEKEQQIITPKAIEKKDEVMQEVKEADEVEEVKLERQEAEPPAVEGGRKVATISGLTEEERVDRVEKRKKSTALTKEEVLNNDLVDLTNQLKTARGLEKANTQAKIRQKVLGLNAEAGFEKYRFDGVAVRKRTESKTKGVRYTKINRTSRDSSGGAIKEDAVLLTDRSPEFTNIFEALVESPALEALQVDRGDGTSMTKEQIQSALEDVLDGIPSVAADNLLNTLEEGFNRGYFDLRAKDLGLEGAQTVQAMLDEFIGAEKEVVGEPMDEEALLKFLEEESILESEEDIELLDNIENLITEYESEPTKTITKGEVSSTKTESETRVTEQPKPTESRKSEGKPKAEVSRQPDEKAKGEPKPKAVEKKEEEPKKISDKAREQAAKLRSGEANVLPDWLRANLPKGTKKQGADINDVYAKALEVFADVYDSVGDFKKAADEAFKGISDWFKENNIDIDEADFKAKFEAQLKGEKVEGGTKKQKKLSILNNLINSEKVSEENKKILEEKGLEYEVSSQSEAQQLANQIVEALGVDAALDAARGELIDPSVGSAVFAESLNYLFNQENSLRAEGKINEANNAAEKWADVSYEYAEISNRKGKWNSQIAYFYKTSPMGFVIRLKEQRAESFKEWFASNEKPFQEVFDIIKESEEFSIFLKGETDKSRVEERKKERAVKKQKVYKKIDDWAEKWSNRLTPKSTKGVSKQGLGVPEVMKSAADLAKRLYDAGDAISKIVEDVTKYVSEKLNNENWDKEDFKNSLSELIENFNENENAFINSLNKRKEELERRISEKDFSAEEYKEKKELNEKEKQAKLEYEKVKKEYDTLKKSSKEYIDNKAKQYLNQLRKKLKGLSEEKKEEIIRRSIKKIIDSGGLKYQEFKDIVSNAIGLGELTAEQIKEIEYLTKQSNDVDQIELDYIKNPTKEGLEKFKKAKQISLEADRKLFELTNNEADITSTVKSIMTLNLLNLSTVVANYFQNAIYQGLVRFPTSFIVNGIEYGKYGFTLLGNKAFGMKVIQPQTDPIKAQKGYWQEYAEGVIRGWEQTIKGVDEKDYFSSSQYSTDLNPLKSYRDLSASIKGDLQLTTKQKIDKFLQSTIGVQAYAISRLMNLGDKPPRYAAQGAEAINIGTNELKITNSLELEAFINSPEKFSYNYFVKNGLSPKDAGLKSKELTKRIVDAGAKAVFQNENLLNFYLSKIDEASKLNKEDSKLVKGFKTFVPLGKAYVLPFVKTPANIWWAYFKINNPALTFAKGIYELYESSAASNKGNFVEANRLRKQSNESFALSVIGYGFAVAAMSLYQKGLVRPSNDDEDKAKETAAESFFGSDNKLNLGKFLGGDDYWVDLTWFPALGAVIDTQANLLEDKKKRGEDVSQADYNFLDDLLPNLKYSSIASLNSLVFDNGARILDGIRKGGNYGESLLVDMVDRATGTVFGSTFQRVSSLALPSKIERKADNIYERISNSVKEKNAIVRMFTDAPKSKISIWGEPIKQDNSPFGILRAMFKIEKGNKEKFGLILYDDFSRTGNVNFLPPYEDAKITHKGKQIELNATQKRDLDIFVGQARKSLIAPYVSDAAIIKGFKNYYSKLTDNEKVEALSVLYKSAKEIGYNKFKEKYTQFADAKIDFKEQVKEAKQKSKSILFEASLPRK